MKTISRYIMTLALLITAVGGAWAQTQITQDFENGLGDWTKANCHQNSGVINTYSPTHSGTNMFRFYYSANTPQYLISPEIDAAGGGTMSFYYARYSDSYPETFKVGYSTTTNDPTAFTWGNEVTCTNIFDSSEGYLEYTYDIPAGAKYVSIACTSNDQYYFFVDDITIDIAAAAAPTDVEVTTNKAENETTFTEASFAMPAYDATADYELVRDIEYGVGVKVNGNQTWGETAASILVKKENGEYPAASTLEVVLTDVLESNATIESSNYAWKLQRLADDGQTWTDLTLAEAKLSPGTYCIVATAADGTPYDGECDGEFTIYENYDLTLSPATNANLKSVTVAGTAKTADEKGVIKNIEPGKKVKITTTGPDYIIRKATVKKTVNMKTLQIGGETTATIYYIEGESWTDAITNHPTENAGWKAFSNQITYDGSAYVLFYGGSTTKVNPGEEIDSTKTYKLES